MTMVDSLVRHATPVGLVVARLDLFCYFFPFSWVTGTGRLPALQPRQPPAPTQARRGGTERRAGLCGPPAPPKKTKVIKCRQALSAPQRWEKGSAQGRGRDPTPGHQTGCVTLSPRRLWPPGEDGMGGTDTPCHPPQRRLRSLTNRHLSPPHRRRGDVAPGRPPVPVSHPPTQQGVSTGARLRARAPRCPPSHGSHQADARPPAAATHPCPAPCQTRRPLPDETRPRDGAFPLLAAGHTPCPLTVYAPTRPTPPLFSPRPPPQPLLARNNDGTTTASERPPTGRAAALAAVAAAGTVRTRTCGQERPWRGYGGRDAAPPLRRRRGGAAPAVSVAAARAHARAPPPPRARTSNPTRQLLPSCAPPANSLRPLFVLSVEAAAHQPKHTQGTLVDGQGGAGPPPPALHHLPRVAPPDTLAGVLQREERREAAVQGSSPGRFFGIGGCLRIGAELLWRHSLPHTPSPLEGERMRVHDRGRGVGRKG